MNKIHINNDDNYATPPEFYDELDRRFDFDFDPCPYNEGEILVDGLAIEWGERNFVNPPYSDLKATGKLKSSFVKKGIEQMNKGKLCVFLLPVSTSTRLFHDYIKPNITDEIEYVDGRIKFGKLDEDGKFYIPKVEYVNKKGETKYREQTGTKDSFVIIFDGRK